MWPQIRISHGPHIATLLDEHHQPIVNHTWLLYRHTIVQTPRLARFIQLLAPARRPIKD